MMKIQQYLLPAALMAAMSACGGKEKASESAAADAEELPVVQVGVAHLRSVYQKRTYTANV